MIETELGGRVLLGDFEGVRGCVTEVVALPLLDGLEEEGLEEGLGLSEDTRVEMVTGILVLVQGVYGWPFYCEKYFLSWCTF